MEHDPLRRSLLAQHPQDIGVRIAIVNHERQSGPLGQVDMPAEVLFLKGRRVRSQ